MPRPTRDVVVSATGVDRGLGARTARRAVTAVLDGEGAGPASVSVTFLSSQRMRALNRRTFRRDRATDVIAYGMPHAGRLVADVYVCPAAARRAAAARGIPEREELVRLVVHGTLHALGYDHPDGHDRTESTMWTRQERYVRDVVGGRA
jgi:probable rRNA maturation factor